MAEATTPASTLSYADAYASFDFDRAAAELAGDLARSHAFRLMPHEQAECIKARALREGA